MANHREIVTAACSAVAGIMGFFMGLWKSKSEIQLLNVQIKKAERELNDKELEVKTKSCIQIISIVANEYQIKAGTLDLVFTEEMLRKFAGDYADRLHAALDKMQKEGKAVKVAPDNWIIH